MTRYYSDETRAADKWSLPDIETFHTADPGFHITEDGEDRGAGWYWWVCLPGCMPDSDAMGPFETEADALADAREFGG